MGGFAGGVGYDINCGCRLMVTDLEESDVKASSRRSSTNCSATSPPEWERVARSRSYRARSWRRSWYKGSLGGRAWIRDQAGLRRTEDGGALPGATPRRSVSALTRAASTKWHPRLGNHFLEVQIVDKVFDAPRRRRTASRRTDHGDGALRITGFRLPGLRDHLETMGRQADVTSSTCRPPTRVRPSRLAGGKQYLAAMPVPPTTPGPTGR